MDERAVRGGSTSPLESVGTQLVILADDGAPPADVAWSWLTSHRWPGWCLQTVTVLEPLFPTGPVSEHSRDVPRHPTAELGLAQWDHLTVTGDPRTVLLRRTDAALVVVGHHHRRHLAGLLAGSTTQWLAVRPPAPLMIVRHGHTTRTAAICVDGSRHARRALEVFLSLPWSPDVTVSLVAVDDGAADVQAALEAAAAAFGKRTPPAQVRLAGPARRALPAYVRANRPDLVVVGAHGLTPRTRLSVGASVSALLTEQTANVLVAYSEVDEVSELPG